MPDDSETALSRRQVLAASGTGLLAATAAAVPAHAATGITVRNHSSSSAAADGTPEQIHLTWGEDPATSVVVSWASQARAIRPRVRIGQRAFPAKERVYSDGLNGQRVWTYHARVTGLRPGATYGYAVTADNDSSSADPFSATFTTAPSGRAEFRFTSFGDLATPNTSRARSYGQAPDQNYTAAVGAVESFQPLFHLQGGGLSYADLNPAAQPAVWRDFGNNNQASAAHRPWMPVPGNHEIEFYNGDQGFSSYLTRYTLPSNGSPEFAGRWYSFRVGSVLLVSLSADDVVYQDSGPLVAGPGALIPASSTGNPPLTAGTSFYIRGYSGGEQTRWLESVLSSARADPSIDWIVVQMHQCACSSSPNGNGSDLGIRSEWLPLFDKYEVDLVLSGHDHDYERSFPVRGFDHAAGTAASGDSAGDGPVVDTYRPRPVTTVDSGVFDTSQGTVHMVLGCGGASANLDGYGVSAFAPDGAGPGPAPSASAGAGAGVPRARVFTRPNRPVPSATPGVYARAGADAVEDAVWSARRDTASGYGIAVFDVDPGTKAGGQTSITVTHYHAAGADPVNPASGAAGAPTGDYSEFERFMLVRPRSDKRRWHARESAAVRALVPPA